MAILPIIDEFRIKVSKNLEPTKKRVLGQFFTPAPISMFMASLFDSIEGDITLLDPGCGLGSLTAAFVDEAVKRNEINTLDATLYDVDQLVIPYAKKALNLCRSEFDKYGHKFNSTYNFKDYILGAFDVLSDKNSGFSHIIMNPPYKKILASSEHRKALSQLGIETVNLYSGFASLAIQQLKPKGELVIIIPRSFCNGPYYKSFRRLIIEQTAIKHIHIFDSRSNAFSDESVLQENIILHLVKEEKQKEVVVTSSPIADFYVDIESKTVTASDMTTRTVCFEQIVKINDDNLFIHIAANHHEQSAVEQINVFNSTIEDLNLKVSTGPVVDFRLKEYLRDNIDEQSVPLIYPIHLNGVVNWPKKSKKPNAIAISEKSKNLLWENKGYFIIVKRLSSKEEKKRIVASIYDSSLPSKFIGFDNKLNIFHHNKTGFDRNLATGLYVYLNSTLIDNYYRLFGGHTQVNATDLKNIKYPSLTILRNIGSKIKNIDLTQNQMDQLIEKEINNVAGTKITNPIKGREKIKQALQILSILGMPKAQQNERSALTLLALINLPPEGRWNNIEQPMIGVTPIMDWCRDVYGKEYAPNTRETFRRQTLHQFVDGGIALYNPDKPERPVNSPKACYQIASELYEVLITFGTTNWKPALSKWLKNKELLIEQYAMQRDMKMIPLILDDGTNIKLSPGIHSQLIHDIVTEFGPRFAPGAEVIYLGDTGAKEDFFKKDRLAKLGVTVDRKGKLPDVVLYWPDRDWLLLIESVTSHGPVDSKRHNELAKLFKDAIPGLVYVTAFPDRKIMGKYLGDISWETEVWVAEAPTHMIHFNGDRFLGPHI